MLVWDTNYNTQNKSWVYSLVVMYWLSMPEGKFGPHSALQNSKTQSKIVHNAQSVCGPWKVLDAVTTNQAKPAGLLPTARHLCFALLIYPSDGHSFNTVTAFNKREKAALPLWNSQPVLFIRISTYKVVSVSVELVGWDSSPWVGQALGGASSAVSFIQHADPIVGVSGHMSAGWRHENK